MSPTTCLALITSRFFNICKLFTTLSERRVVSKPEILSRLRYVNIIERRDETDAERAYRAKYEELQTWNNRYWAENNETFQREKNEYIEKNFGPEVSKEEALSHDQLAAFYRYFLEKNRDKHVEYNKIWYRNHAALLSSSIEAKLSRFRANISAIYDLK